MPEIDEFVGARHKGRAKFFELLADEQRKISLPCASFRLVCPRMPGKIVCGDNVNMRIS